MEKIRTNAAGIDIGSRQVFVSVSAATTSVSSNGRSKPASCFLQQISLFLSLQKVKAVR
jgi:hypothetical protein